MYDVTYFDSGYDYTKDIDTEVNAIIIRTLNLSCPDKILKFITNNFQSIHGYISDNWINITEKSVTKSNGIKYLQNKLHLDNIYTIGDTINDIDMIKKYDGACMNNSTNDLKNICNNYFNSVAEYIDYICKEGK